MPQLAQERPTGRAARQFAAMSLGSALLAVASAALFYRSAGSSGSLAIAAADCFVLAVLLPVVAWRALRKDTFERAIARGLDEATARRRATAIVSHCIRRPATGRPRVA